MAKTVDLGFVEKTDDWRLLSHFFPSKVGGKPAWLNLESIPKPEDITCGKCKNVCSFLLQVYAPDPLKDSCFHRTVFVFVCRNTDCTVPNDNSGLLVLRCQLHKNNSFYGDEPPDEDKFDEKSDYPRASNYQNLCSVCHCAASKFCAKCHNQAYCSREHQVVDWKNGHKLNCGKDLPEKGKMANSSKVCFPEFELLIESEELSDDTEAEKSEETKLDEYRHYLESNQDKLHQYGGKSTENDLEKMAGKESDDFKQFKTFKKRIQQDPDQVLRYDKGGCPLWVSIHNQPGASDIPNCTCGKPRQFEFQILPQLLNYLGTDAVERSLDWGTLAVYTCTDNCDSDIAYKPEFIWKQDFTEEQIE